MVLCVTLDRLGKGVFRACVGRGVAYVNIRYNCFMWWPWSLKTPSFLYMPSLWEPHTQSYIRSVCSYIFQTDLIYWFIVYHTRDSNHYVTDAILKNIRVRLCKLQKGCTQLAATTECISADCCFSVLALLKFNLACWSTGTRIPDRLLPHFFSSAIKVWIFVWKYIVEPFIHILQHLVYLNAAC
jgi:hypothetical protein